MTLPTNAPLPIGSGERLSGDVPTDGMLNQVTPLIPSELEHLPESHTTMDKLSREDWTQLMQYRKLYHQEEQAKQALEMLAVQKDSPSYGFRINNYRHSLQSATMVYRDGGDDEDVVVALFHDIGFVVCPDNHGEFSATMLANYVSKQN